jgi:nicotinate-nucleotide adenylyltransferase
MHLDKILFVPSGVPPLKAPEEILDIKHRLEMVKIAIEDNPFFEVSSIEITAKGKTFTVDTLLSLRKKYGNEVVTFYLIIGMDNLAVLHTWKDPGKLFLLSEVVVINRPGYLISDVNNEFSRQVLFVPVPDVNISSSDIRLRVQENKSIKYLVPAGVEKYIYENNLYTL